MTEPNLIGPDGFTRLAPTVPVEAMTATIRPVARPRGELTDDQRRLLSRAKREQEVADIKYRAAVVRTLAEGASFAEVSKATGLSTNTLQRWKREASAS